MEALANSLGPSFVTTGGAVNCCEWGCYWCIPAASQRGEHQLGSHQFLSAHLRPAPPFSLPLPQSQMLQCGRLCPTMWGRCCSHRMKSGWSHGSIASEQGGGLAGTAECLAGASITPAGSACSLGCVLAAQLLRRPELGCAWRQARRGDVSQRWGVPPEIGDACRQLFNPVIVLSVALPNRLIHKKAVAKVMEREPSIAGKEVRRHRAPEAHAPAPPSLPPARSRRAALPPLPAFPTSCTIPVGGCSEGGAFRCSGPVGAFVGHCAIAARSLPCRTRDAVLDQEEMRADQGAGQEVCQAAGRRGWRQRQAAVALRYPAPPFFVAAYSGGGHRSAVPLLFFPCAWLPRISSCPASTCQC